MRTDDPLARGDGDEWHRFGSAWHAAFAALAVLTAALVALDDGIGPTARPVALGLTAALAGWYGAVGARAVGARAVGARAVGARAVDGRAAGGRAAGGARAVANRAGWWGPAYLAVAVPLTVGLFAAVPVGALLLFVLYPHIWLMLRPRRAVPATVAVVAAVTALTVARHGIGDRYLAEILLMTTVSLAAAVLLGLWIGRIIRQSRQRAELLAELAATRAELAAVSHDAGTLAERERLAHEIHDTLAQGFASVLLLLEAVDTELDTDAAAAHKHLDRARDTARENLAEARALVAALTPPELTSTSLPGALRRLVERAGADPGLRAALAVTGTPRGLPTEHEVALLRAAQEALTNVGRHAAASRVEVTLAYGPAGVSLRVRDDGRGFDPAAPPPEGYGLGGMRARATRIGGLVSVNAAPGDGVAVRFDVPVAGG